MYLWLNLACSGFGLDNSNICCWCPCSPNHLERGVILLVVGLAEKQLASFEAVRLCWIPYAAPGHKQLRSPLCPESLTLYFAASASQTLVFGWKVPPRKVNAPHLRIKLLHFAWAKCSICLTYSAAFLACVQFVATKPSNQSWKVMGEMSNYYVIGSCRSWIT